MSAVLAHPAHSPNGVEVTASAPGQDALLTPAALELLASLHRLIEPQRQARLAARIERQAFFDAGGLPDFREDTRGIREGEWKVTALPSALQDRRVEITGPVDPKMVINALNSGAKVFMADFEDSTAPAWRNLLAGQQALIGAVRSACHWVRCTAGRRAPQRPATADRPAGCARSARSNPRSRP